MIVTNINNLPEPLVRAVTRHPRERIPGRISVSELIQPPQLRALSVKHDSELSEDASDRLWSLMGTLLHGVLERNAKGLKDTISEEALEAEFAGWTLVGHYDLSELVLDGELLTDWKLTSVWSVKDGVKTEWEQQLNCYAELIRRAGREVSQLQIVAVGRDWSKNKAKFDPGYPQQQVKVMAVPLWSPVETAEFIRERVALHQAAEKGTWPDCTEEERWARPTQWALMKKTQKKAVKLFDKKEHAYERLTEMIKGAYEVVERPGANVRCDAYCAVANVCPQKARMDAAPS